MIQEWHYASASIDSFLMALKCANPYFIYNQSSAVKITRGSQGGSDTCPSQVDVSGNDILTPHLQLLEQICLQMSDGSQGRRSRRKQTRARRTHLLSQVVLIRKPGSLIGIRMGCSRRTTDGCLGCVGRCGFLGRFTLNG